jgi:hypothetical protein
MVITRIVRAAAGPLAVLTAGLTLTASVAAQAAQAAPAARPTQTARSHENAATGLTASLATYKYTLSRIAWNGSHILIAAVDSHGDLYFFWQQAGTTTWHKQLVAAAGKKVAYHSPSITWTGHAVAIAAVDKAGDLVYFSEHSGSSKWRYQRVAKAFGAKFSAPSIAAVSGGPVLISVDKPGALVSYELATGSTTWTRRIVASGTFGAPSIITAYDAPVSQYLALITATTSTHNLDFWWERLDVPGWNEETIATGGSVGGSLAATSKDLLLTAGTINGGVDEWYQAIGSSGWNEQTVAGPSLGAPYKNPQIAWTGPVPDETSTYDLITASQAGAVVFWWNFDGLNSSWQQEKVAGAGSQASYASPAISVTGKSTIITAVNTKPGDVDFWYQKYGTNAWKKQRVAKG